MRRIPRPRRRCPGGVRERRLLVLPTYYREGVPRVLLEASAMALPVIASDWPGCVEAVDDGVTGLLCAAPFG